MAHFVRKNQNRPIAKIISGFTAFLAILICFVDQIFDKKDNSAENISRHMLLVTFFFVGSDF